jgi:hypothetical protein
MMKTRNSGGSSIVEIGCSLILLVIAFAALLALVSMAAIFSSGWYLNYLETRQLAITNPAEQAAALHQVRSGWLKSGFAAFARVAACDVSECVRYIEPSSTSDPLVEVRTSVRGRLFFGPTVTFNIVGVTLLEYRNSAVDSALPINN